MAATEKEPTDGEVDPAVLAAIESEMGRKASEFEKARLVRAQALEVERGKKAARVTRQFWFLFGLLVFAFILLAYRTEVTQDALRDGLYEACEKRVTQIRNSNVGREALIQLVLNSPSPNPQSAEQKAQTVEQLRAGLLLPVEICGEDPR